MHVKSENPTKTKQMTKTQETFQINTRQFEILRGHPGKYFKGIRWFLIDGTRRFQVFALNWESAKEQVLRSNPDAHTIKLLTK